MTPQEVKAFVAKYTEARSRLDAVALGALYAENCVVDSPAGGGTVAGRDAIENISRDFFAAFPDLTVENQQVVSEGSHIALLFTAVGTNAGGFMGLQPTGKQFRFNGAFIFTVENGQITRERRIYDFTGVLVQIGVLKAKPQ
jgi:steroid delta-isomerase-like uncharacterized protein